MSRTIPERESLTVEFESDRRRLPDGELVAAVICLANTVGGEIFLGVEDDGTITGLHPDHQHTIGLAALIANRTIPPVGVRVAILHEASQSVARIEVPRSLRLAATSEGLLQRRRLQADGTPVCVPFYPHEFAGRQADLGLLDYSARVSEDELPVGPFRVPVPNYDGRAFREALVNALVHRDYTRLGTVFVRWERESITITNPGGFVEGVTLDNLLVIEPRPRNPVLADAIKRIGLAERTGRGVDLIYQGLLRYGRPAPEYGRSNASAVTVRLPGGAADMGLLRIIIEEERRSNGTLPVEALIALYQLRHERRVTADMLARATQRDETAARGILERLVEAGLVEAHPGRNGREYTASATLYRHLGQPQDYVRQTAFNRVQQEQMVLRYVEVQGQITRKDTVELCRIGDDQARRLLDRLVKSDRLQRVGKITATAYTLPGKT